MRTYKYSKRDTSRPIRVLEALNQMMALTKKLANLLARFVNGLPPGLMR